MKVGIDTCHFFGCEHKYYVLFTLLYSVFGGQINNFKIKYLSMQNSIAKVTLIFVLFN